MEIGPQAISIYELSPGKGREIVDTKAKYIAVDIAPDLLAEVREDILRSQVDRDVVVGDVNRLPFQDNSVRELWMNNVLSVLIKDGNYLRDIDASTKGVEAVVRGVLLEITRVMKMGGKAYILESYTSGGSGLLTMDPEVYSEMGFEHERLQGSGLIDFLRNLGLHESNVRLHGQTKHPDSHPPILIALTKMG